MHQLLEICSQSEEYLSCLFNSIRGLFAGGYINTPASTTFNIVDYVTIASQETHKILEIYLLEGMQLSACASPTRGIFSGGLIPYSN
jgi:hypothetical protein